MRSRTPESRSCLAGDGGQARDERPSQNAQCQCQPTSLGLPHTPARTAMLKTARARYLWRRQICAECPISEPGRRVDHHASSRRASVIIEEPAKTLTTANAADLLHRGCAVDQFVTKALVIALTVVVLDELRDRPAEMTFAERDHPVQALVLDRAHKAFGVGIRIGRLIRRLHHADPRFAQPRARARSTSRLDQRSLRDGHPGPPRPRRRACGRPGA